MNSASVVLYIIGGLITIAFLYEVAMGRRRDHLRTRGRRATH
jgi:hypothetical protein